MCVCVCVCVCVEAGGGCHSPMIPIKESLFISCSSQEGLSDEMTIQRYKYIYSLVVGKHMLICSQNLNGSTSRID